MNINATNATTGQLHDLTCAIHDILEERGGTVHVTYARDKQAPFNKEAVAEANAEVLGWILSHDFLILDINFNA